MLTKLPLKILCIPGTNNRGKGLHKILKIFSLFKLPELEINAANVNYIWNDRIDFTSMLI